MCGLARTRNNAGMTSMLPRDLLLRSLPFRGEVSARSRDEAVGAASISSFVCTSFHDFCGTYKHRVEVLYPKRRPVSVQQGRYLKERATSRTWARCALSSGTLRFMCSFATCNIRPDGTQGVLERCQQRKQRGVGARRKRACGVLVEQQEEAVFEV